MEKNKTGKYLKYAIGEIVLVVIGILIALQINNWNEFRKKENLEIDYLKGVKFNLEEDITELEKHFSTDTLKLDAYTFLINAAFSNDLKSKESEIILSYYTTFGLNWFEGQNVVFQNITSSGHLNLIQSDSIRYYIQKYYRYFEETIKQESINNEQILLFGDSNSKFLNAASFLEHTFEKRWKANAGPPDISIMYSQEFDDIKPLIIDNISIMKTYTMSSHKARKKLYNQAKSLEKLIDKYIMKNK